jgi:MFS transporter, DHA1 family, multidrug resistance protein
MIPLGIATSLSLLGDLALFTVLAAQRELLVLTLTQVGILLSIHRFIRIPGNLLVGPILDRYGRRRLFVLGMVLAVISTGGYALAIGFWPFLLTRLTWGTAWILINVSSLTIVLDISTENTRGKMNGTLNAWAWGGYAAGPLLGGLLVDFTSFQTAMWVCASLSAVGLGVAAYWLPETRHLNPHYQTNLTLKRKLDFYVFIEDWKTALHGNVAAQRGLILFALTQFTGDGIILGTLTLLIAERLTGGLHIGNNLLGVASMGGIVLMLRSILAGTAGLIVASRSDRNANRIPFILISLVAAASAFLLLANAYSLEIILMGVALGAASAGAIQSTLTAYIGDHTPPEHQGALMGVYAAAGDAGSMLGPALGFLLIPIIGLRWLYTFCAGLFGFGAVLISQKSPKKDREFVNPS